MNKLEEIISGKLNSRKSRKPKRSILLPMLAGLLISAFSQPIQFKPGCRIWAEQNLKRIMRAQEQKLGIRHLGVPRLDFAWSLGDKGDFETYAAYNPETNTITLRYSLSEPERTLNHELGHSYVDRLREFLLDTTLYDSSLSNSGKFLISEGIAEYFDRTMSNTTERNSAPASYNLAYHIVKPVIDEYGVMGIKHLITNIPTEREINSFGLFDRYQNRILRSLGRE